VAKKSTEKFVYITHEGEGEDRYPLIHASIVDAYINTPGMPVTVEVYKLIKTVSVTREETYKEELL
jgi:hypothetical protein